MIVPYLDLTYTNLQHKATLLNAVERVIDSGWTILGKEVQNFENSWAKYVGSQYAIGVANGLDAMIIALEVLGVGPGDEVIVPSNTYIATWLAVSRVGATIVPVEPNEHTYNIEVNQIKEAISPRTKAVIVVHLYGRPCKMKEIMEMARKEAIFVIEDNAQAQGAKTNGQFTSSFGHINATSLYPGKNLGALGDGGIITTNDEEWYELCQSYRNYGSRIKYENEVLGFNSRLDEIQAAIVSEKLSLLEDWNNQRRQIASLYRNLLTNISDLIILPEEDEGNVWHIYPVFTPVRVELMQHLKSFGIGTLIHYPIPPHLQKAYHSLGMKIGDFPIAERLAGTELSLPIYPGITTEQVEYVSKKIIEFYN